MNVPLTVSAGRMGTEPLFRCVLHLFDSPALRHIIFRGPMALR